MPHVSRRRIDKTVLNRILEAFVSVLADCKTDQEVSAFLDSILTATEKVMLAKRLGVVILLQEKIPIDQINETLKVTRNTIEKIRLLLSVQGRGYQLALGKLKRRANWRKLKNTLIYLAGKALYYGLKR